MLALPGGERAKGHHRPLLGSGLKCVFHVPGGALRVHPTAGAGMSPGTPGGVRTELTGEGGQDRDGSVQMGTAQGRKSCQSQHKVCAQLLPCL